jgi:hypothetical protein
LLLIVDADFPSSKSAKSENDQIPDTLLREALLRQHLQHGRFLAEPSFSGVTLIRSSSSASAKHL